MEKFKSFLYYCGICLLALILFCGSIENGVLLTILSFAFLSFFVNKVSIKRFSLFLIFFCLVTKVIAIFLIHTPITGDFVLMYDTAKHIAVEGFFIAKHSYFACWGYQLFHVFYEALMLSIIDSVTFLKILNCIYSTVTTVMIYLIVRRLTNEKTARMTSLLYAISLYPIYLNTVLGNQQLALMIAMIAIYLLLYHKNSLPYMALIGILFGISHLERNEGIVYLLTSLVYLFLFHQGFKDFFKKAIVLTFCFFFVTKGSSFLVQKLGINEIGFGNANPEWKFLLGFNFDTNGVYDVNDEMYLNDLEAEKKEILNRITNVQKLPSLFYHKIQIQFLYDDFGKSFEEGNPSSIMSSFKTTIFQYTKVMNYVIVFLAFFGFVKNKSLKREGDFFLINFLIFFGVYMLIEICARYYYNPQATIFILSAFGIKQIFELVDKKNLIYRNRGGNDFFVS